MKGKRLLVGVLVVVALALAGGVSLAQGPGPEEEVAAEGDVSIAATVSTKISYQGVLKENGEPVTGTRDMTFRLYSDSDCTTQVGSDIDKAGVQVTDGLFSVDLEVSHGDFNGQALWLEVEVGGTKIGCQEILPVPYALSLRPGAVISDTDAFVGVNYSYRWPYPSILVNTYGTYARLEGDSPLAYYYAVYGSVESSHGYAGYFRNTNSAGHSLYTQAGSNDAADLVLGGNSDTHDNGTIYSDPAYSSSDIVLVSNDNVWIDLDSDGDGEDADFEIYVGSNRIFDVDESGDVYADGNFNAGGADFAEMLPAVEGLEPGDVLAIGPDGRLILSTEAYQTNVVGVYSSDPGFIGGRVEDRNSGGEIPLAIMGVVPVKATAENGPIRPGDLLVASSMPGHAMKAGPNPPVGSVIGKALEGLEEGTGVIRMLVIPQ